LKRFNPIRGELALSAAYVLVGCAVLARLLISGHAITGGENAVAADQLQYLSWIVAAAKSTAINSLWSIPAQTGSWFVHPGFSGSGLLVRAGLDPIVAYQLWKPVSLLMICVAFALYVRRLLPEGGARTAGLALALFGLSPAGALIGWNSLASGQGLQSQLEFAAGEVFAPSWQWGYMMTAIAVALMVFGLLAAEAALRVEGSRWSLVAATLAGFFCSWLQPWQGAELIGAIALCDLLRPVSGSRLAGLRRHAPALIAGLLPLIYYRWLSGHEDVWKLAGSANNSIALWSAGAWILTLGIYLPAVLAFKRKPADWQEHALRLVPALMIAQYAAIAIAGQGTFPFHAIQGIGLFLGILLVKGMLEVRSNQWWAGRTSLVVLLCGLICVPGTVHRLNLMRLDIHRSAQPYFLETGEAAALARLASDPEQGGVLAPIKAALSFPSKTGRPVWVGQISWTPNFRGRVAAAELLFRGRLSPTEARALVDKSGARFLYSDCGHRSDLRPLLGDMVTSFTRFGCASLYRVRREARS